MHFFIAKFLVIVGSSFTVVKFFINNNSLGEINRASKTIRKLFKHPRIFISFEIIDY